MSSFSWYSNCPDQELSQTYNSLLLSFRMLLQESAMKLMASGAFPITGLKHSQRCQSWSQCQGVPAQPLYRPVLMSQQKAHDFYRCNFLLLWDIKKFFSNEPGVLLLLHGNVLDGQLKGGASSLGTSHNLADLSKTQVYTSLDSSSSHVVLEEPPPPAEMRGSCSSEPALYHLRTDCSNMFCWFYETDKCPLGHKV